MKKTFYCPKMCGAPREGLNAPARVSVRMFSDTRPYFSHTLPHHAPPHPQDNIATPHLVSWRIARSLYACGALQGASVGVQGALSALRAMLWGGTCIYPRSALP